MYAYLIEKKIITPISIYEKLKLLGYDFREVSDSPVNLIISKEIKARNVEQALLEFFNGLDNVLDYISVLSQCVVDEVGSYSVYRRGDDFVVFQYFEPRDDTGLDINLETKNDIEKLEKENPNLKLAFSYLREAIQARTPIPRLAMYIGATESLAGNENVVPKCSKCNKTLICKHCGGKRPKYSKTNDSKLREILGDELFDKLYKKDRVRHRLLHGYLIERRVALQINDELHNQLIHRYLAAKYDLKSINKEAVNLPRNISLMISAWCFRITGSNRPTLEGLIDRWNKKDLGEHIDLPKDY